MLISLSCDGGARHACDHPSSNGQGRDIFQLLRASRVVSSISDELVLELDSAGACLATQAAWHWSASRHSELCGSQMKPGSAPRPAAAPATAANSSANSAQRRQFYKTQFWPGSLVGGHPACWMADGLNPPWATQAVRRLRWLQEVRCWLLSLEPSALPHALSTPF